MKIATGELRMSDNVFRPIDRQEIQEPRPQARVPKARDQLREEVRKRTARLTAANERLKRELEERKQAEEVLRKDNQALKHLLLTSDYERRSIACEIHDTLAQQITAATMQFQAYEQLRKKEPRTASDAFGEGIHLLRECQLEVRRLISGVRPHVLEQLGVVGAITDLIRSSESKSGPHVEFCHNVTFERLDPIEENVIFRIAQEGLTNARKHSQSAHVRIELVQRQDKIRLTIQDWGVGFNRRKIVTQGFGLDGIRQRSRLLGGQANVKICRARGLALPSTCLCWKEERRSRLESKERLQGRFVLGMCASRVSPNVNGRATPASDLAASTDALPGGCDAVEASRIPRIAGMGSRRSADSTIRGRRGPKVDEFRRFQCRARISE